MILPINTDNLPAWMFRKFPGLQTWPRAISLLISMNACPDNPSPFLEIHRSKETF